MAKNQEISISFSGGIQQSVPKTLLPLPLLTKARNLIIKDSGRLENRLEFKQLSGLKLPDGSGTPLKLFTYNDALYAITDKNILLWEASSNRWVDFVARLSELRRGRFRNMGLKAHRVTQKEQDVQNLAFAQFGQSLVFFYTYKSNAPVGTIFYKIWSIPDQRVVGGERQFRIDSSAVTGLFALSEGTNKLWLGVSYANNIKVHSFNPFTRSQVDRWEASPAVAGIQRFILHKDRVFYTIDGSTVQSQVFNSTATEKATANEITSIPDPSATSQDFSNTPLHDFRDWVDFSYTPAPDSSEAFKMVWSVQTGFYIINANNHIVGHLYGNFTPYNTADPPRMAYGGGAYQIAGKVYLPILRSGQPEVVNREAITDRIVPQGQQLAVFRPLGLELLELDFSDLTAPQAEQIDQQMLISGHLLKDCQ